MTVEWVKSHSGVELHDLADRLAKESCDENGPALQAERYYDRCYYDP